MAAACVVRSGTITPHIFRLDRTGGKDPHVWARPADLPIYLHLYRFICARSRHYYSFYSFSFFFHSARFKHGRFPICIMERKGGEKNSWEDREMRPRRFSCTGYLSFLRFFFFFFRLFFQSSDALLPRGFLSPRWLVTFMRSLAIIVCLILPFSRADRKSVV